MCLIAFALHAHPRWPLVLAGNRDEFHGRPTEPLAAWADSPAVMAGRDLSAGGGWLGVNRGGRLAAVTNVRRMELPTAPRSRGALVADFLRGRGPAGEFAEALSATAAEYGLFNLLLVSGSIDRLQAVYTSNQATVATQALAPGVYGLSNAALDTPWPKTVQLKQALTDWLGQPHGSEAAGFAPLLAALSSEHIAADADLPNTGVGVVRERMLAPAFIRGALYGTRCSTVVAVAANGSGVIHERRFGAEGLPLGDTALQFQWPDLS